MIDFKNWTTPNVVVKNRMGSVLGRNIILKSDHFYLGYPKTKVPIVLHGAPNFRAADLNVYGVGQPTISGIINVLTVLNSHPHSPCQNKTIWFSAREEPMIYINRKPFVIRSCTNPRENIKIYQGISVSTLEQMENRLKQDILAEKTQFNGLILVHEEKDGGLVPLWLAPDMLETPRQVFESLNENGYSVLYYRIPISPEQAPEDKYIDEYLQIIKASSLDDRLIFSAGMGAGRTTFVMVLAYLVRYYESEKSISADFKFSSVQSLGPRRLSHEASALQTMNSKGMLRLVHLLDKVLPKDKVSVAEWLMTRTSIISDLQNALDGNFHCVLRLVGAINDGQAVKLAVDKAISKCDVLFHLRERILLHRIEYYVNGGQDSLYKALGCLDRYMFLIAFCSYLESSPMSIFSEWLESRPELWNMLKRVRKSSPILVIFRPVEDLSPFKEETESDIFEWSISFQAKEIIANTIKNRLGSVLGPYTILKEDFWAKEPHICTIEGASNFRKVKNYAIYGVAQPTVDGMKNVILNLAENMTNVVWINLREEPLIYLNDQFLTLRNTKSYIGITCERLALLETKLREDLLLETSKYNGKILLHHETENGNIEAAWEECPASYIQTLTDTIKSLETQVQNLPQFMNNKELHLAFHRVPITSELPPDPSIFDQLIQIISEVNLSNSCIVLNCQIGIGRSTLGTIIAYLIIRWIQRDVRIIAESAKTNTYQSIQSLVRVLQNGLECKAIVDEAIDSCSQIVNIRDTISEIYQSIQIETNSEKKEALEQKGLSLLGKYFNLILFQSYLDQNPPDVMKSQLLTFKKWLILHPEFETIREQMNDRTPHPLSPVSDDFGTGPSISLEISDVVNSRCGAVLATGTIIKYDVFPGAQKLSLPERIDGVHNFRRVNLVEIRNNIKSAKESQSPSTAWAPDSLFLDSDSFSVPYVYGVGMPSKDGIVNLLTYLGASSNGERTIFWTSLREEPVVYVKKRPHVLRLWHNPLQNLEATGIARERVERMEIQMKEEIIQELTRYGNKLLLHEEKIDAGKFVLVPVWESVSPEDIETPLEVYQSIIDSGFKVDYQRIPITDEQSPIPDVFDQIVARLLSVPARGDLLFNCQMGRGRTTTGMVIASLMQQVIGNSEIVEDMNRMRIEMLSLEDELPSQDYLKGNYIIIQQLISVLGHGKISKLLTDIAIDSNSHMQNLRTSINDYRMRLLDLTPDTEKYRVTFEIGCNYLIRYFYLITFCDYLIEIWSDWTRLASKQTFSKWLENRREIQSIIRGAQSLD